MILILAGFVIRFDLKQPHLSRVCILVLEAASEFLSLFKAWIMFLKICSNISYSFEMF